MMEVKPSAADPGPRPTPYWRVVADLVGVLGILVALALVPILKKAPKPPGPARPASRPSAPEAIAVAPPVALPRPVRRPTLDREAVSRSEEAVEEARRDRERAEARADEAERAFHDAETQAARLALAAKTLPLRVKDPSSRIERAIGRGGFLRAELAALKGELAAIQHAPRPSGKLLTDKSPVATRTVGDEFHFEIRRGRVTPIDLERLLDRLQRDARSRLRLGDGVPRTIEATVGPVGAFSISYVLGRNSADELLGSKGMSFTLLGWELVPESDARGESFDDAMRPISDFSRAIHRLNPSRDSITMWVYPDGFDLYRKLREILHAQGFVVAARPLPAMMPIRGSPTGSVSAGQ